MMQFGHKVQDFDCTCPSTYCCEEIQQLPQNNCEKCGKLDTDIKRYCCLILALHCTLDCTHYRPQRSCDKVMSLHLSVILFTGGCLYPGGSLSLSRGFSIQGVSVQGGLCQVDPPLPYSYMQAVCIILECILVITLIEIITAHNKVGAR